MPRLPGSIAEGNSMSDDKPKRAYTGYHLVLRRSRLHELEAVVRVEASRAKDLQERIRLEDAADHIASALRRLIAMDKERP